MIRWISADLGTAPASEISLRDDVYLVDVRDLVDKGGNSVAAVSAKIEEGVAALSRGERVVVGCDYGISRSNAVAAGVLARHAQLTFSDAVLQVQEKTGETAIKLEPLDVVRRALADDDADAAARGVTTALLTGGHGFIGRRLDALLRRQGLDTLTPGRGEIDLAAGTTALGLLVAERRPDVLVHLATPRVYASNEAMGETLVMLRNVLEVCSTYGVRFVYPSSWEVFSGYEGRLTADESTRMQPSGPYGETKMLAEHLIGHFRAARGLDATVVRSGPAYGDDADRPRFIRTFIAKARRGEPIITHRYRNGDPMLDLIHGDDLSRALAAIVGSSVDGTIHIGSGAAISTAEIARFVVAELASSSTVATTDIESATAQVTLDTAKAQRLLGWQPEVTWHSGLRTLLAASGEGAA